MWKKILLIAVIALLVLGSVAMIGWIGFQEKIRLAVRSFEKEQGEEQEVVRTESDPSEKDHTVVETKKEAVDVVGHLEGIMRTLEEDNLPNE